MKKLAIVALVSLFSSAVFAAPPNGTPTGLEFGSPINNDLQRGAGEPIIDIDGDGTVYTCGPTGFSQNQDYTFVSLDGGDQYNPVGQYPRGQFSVGGGGDCAFATGPVRTAAGFYPFAYTGLGGLVTFTSATSPDRGATVLVANTSPLPGTDRQWNVFSSANTVFHTYNRIGAQSGLNVQRSDDGGLTYGRETVVSPSPGGQGQIRAMPPELNPAANGLPVVYYPWSQGPALRLAVSLDEGATWNNCTVSEEASGDTANKFPIADHDNAGNIYFAITESNSWDTFVTTVRNAELLNCTGGINGAGTVELAHSPYVQVNRDNVDSTAFPWLVASGEPGRVAVAFYGSPMEGAPDDLMLPHVWDVYVSQSLNALDETPDYYQVKASSHPMHYDQICQNGLGCTLGGDRSLVDFFAIDLNPANGELLVTYNWAHKRPGDVAGQFTATMVVRQAGGPSNLGGEIDNADRRGPRQRTVDPAGDAYSDFSNLFVAGRRGNTPAMDVLGVDVLPPVRGDGLTARIQIADLSDNALRDAPLALPAQSLLWIFYYVDGYRHHAASARWNPIEGFTFGFNGYEGALQECSSPPVGDEDPTQPLPAAAQNPGGLTGPDQCLYYRGTTPLAGRVDQAAGIIELDIPLSFLTTLKTVEPPLRSPAEVPAQPGDTIFSAAVYTQGNSVSPTQLVQSWLIPVDNTAAMDFLVPGGAATEGPKSVVSKEGGGLLVGALPLFLLLGFAGAALLSRRRHG